MTAAPHFSIRAQWSGELWVWFRPLRLAAEPQCCRTQEWEEGKITASVMENTSLTIRCHVPLKE